MKAENKAVTNYWLEFYCEQLCTLCGNHGIVDTRGVKSPAGVETGRLNWCICPNGQAMRDHYSGLPTEEHLL